MASASVQSPLRRTLRLPARRLAAVLDHDAVGLKIGLTKLLLLLLASLQGGGGHGGRADPNERTRVAYARSLVSSVGAHRLTDVLAAGARRRRRRRGGGAGGRPTDRQTRARSSLVPRPITRSLAALTSELLAERFRD